jgi:hypothetical protein
VTEEAHGPESDVLVVLMPIYDDWESATVLVDRVHRALHDLPVHAEFLLVDDGSTIEPPTHWPRSPRGLVRTALGPAHPPRVDVLRLRRNLGHQRAIAIGISYVREHRPCLGAVVMDGDGEDSADGVYKLVERFLQHDGAMTVFARRARRTEGATFKISYVLFKAVHRILTGHTVRVGNFSVIARRHIERLVAVSELWNHYAASVYKARLPFDTVPIDRDRRIAGQSRMNFVSLLAHGLSAVSVFADVVGLRMLLATFTLGFFAFAGMVAVAGIRLTTDLAIPGWATTATGVLIVILLQAFLMAFVFVFITLQSRNSSGFLPIRDYAYFVHRVDRVPTDVEHI